MVYENFRYEFDAFNRSIGDVHRRLARSLDITALNDAVLTMHASGITERQARERCLYALDATGSQPPTVDIISGEL